jgi:hypothetical protein
MRNTLFFFIGIFFLSTFASSPKSVSKIGGIGGQAIFDSVAQRFIIKSLEKNAYFNAKTLKPGDLILEIDKIPIHKMSYGDVLSLVQGTVGMPMSLKIMRYNAIEKYYEIKRIRVTLDMNPTWWQIPDYKYFEIMPGINFIVKDLKSNARFSLDTTTKIFNTKDRFYSKYNLKGAYESKLEKNEKGKFSFISSFVKTEDRSKAEGMYLFLLFQLKNISVKNVQFSKSESILPNSKTLSYKTKEASDVSLLNLKIDVRLLQEFDNDENKDLWKVEMVVRL